MNALEITLWAMGWGIVSTILLHISKAMERQGIEIFDQIRAKLKDTDAKIEGGTKKPTIYMVGLVINNLTVIWMMLATSSGAPASYFTSVFGIGLIALMLYSSRILHEPIQKIEIIGAIILIIGTLIIGIELILTDQPAMVEIIPEKVFLTVGICFVIGLSAVGFAYKKGNVMSVGIIFGLFAGLCGSLDPIFKGMGQSLGGQAGLFPTTTEGWFVFLFSFLCGSGAFIFTQWGFARKAQASVLVPCYNTLYVVYPIIIQIIALPGFITTGYTLLGIVLIVIGIVLMQIFKKSTNPHAHSNTTETLQDNSK